METDGQLTHRQSTKQPSPPPLDLLATRSMPHRSAPLDRTLSFNCAAPGSLRAAGPARTRSPLLHRCTPLDRTLSFNCAAPGSLRAAGPARTRSPLLHRCTPLDRTLSFNCAAPGSLRAAGPARTRPPPPPPLHASRTAHCSTAFCNAPGSLRAAGPARHAHFSQSGTRRFDDHGKLEHTANGDHTAAQSTCRLPWRGALFGRGCSLRPRPTHSPAQPLPV